ncbi:CHAT domain-containing protein [Isoptericola sp. F-RaC21]|uniref:CHAT domain-containing protein n=1 Tax=Isoptericola sp. F-RaC21 TaxID=3141452 RepID=UPI00315B7FE1
MDDDLAPLAAAVDEARRLARDTRNFDHARRRYQSALEELAAVEARLGSGPVATLQARAIVGMASCDVELGADASAVLPQLDVAESSARTAGDPNAVAVVRGFRGLILLRAGDVTRARSELDAALGGLDDEVEKVPVLLNRGSLRLETGEVDGAVRDFEQCRDLAHAEAVAAFRPMAEHNLGYALYLRGDLPAALRTMESAARSAPEEHAGVSLMDRATILYEAGLVSDATRAIEQAEAILVAQGSEADLARARWALSRCLVLLERFEEAARVASSARVAFERQANDAWAARAELVELEALLAEAEVTGHSGRAAVQERAHDVAERWAQPPVTVPARLLEAEAAIRDGAHQLARVALLEAQDGTRRQPLSVRIQFEAAVAQLAFVEGDRRRGLAAVRRGLDLLSSHRAQLGSLDVVTAAALHGVRLAVVDVKAALDTGRAGSFFDAVERGRATFAGVGRVTPPADAETAALITGARREVEAAQAEDTPRAREGHLQAARELQDAARRRSWQVSGGHVDAPRPATARGVRTALGRTVGGRPVTVVSFAVVQGSLFATRLDAGRQQLIPLGEWGEVAEKIHRVRADLAVLANLMIPEELRAGARSSVSRALKWLDDRLLAPLCVRGDLHVVGRHLMLAVPWTALPSRHRARTWVNSWVDLRPAEPRRSQRALVVIGPDLASSSTEAGLVAGAWRDASVLEGSRATCAATFEALRGADVVHLAAHGTHEPDNPLFSSLRLADGPLFAYELDGTDLSGATVVLSACEVGRSTPRIGGEPLGLTSVLLRLGANAVVASVGPLRDEVAARVMPGLHEGLRAGMRPGEALARAVADEPEPVPLVCFGPLVL